MNSKFVLLSLLFIYELDERGCQKEELFNKLFVDNTFFLFNEITGHPN